MITLKDGPCSSHFTPLSINGNTTLDQFANLQVSAEMAAAVEHFPHGECIAWGIPFQIGDPIVLVDQPAHVDFDPVRVRWLVFLHTSDLRPPQPGPGGFISPMRGSGQLAEEAARYTIQYSDGTEVSAPILRRHQVGAFQRHWGENCFQAVAHRKHLPIRASHEQTNPNWGRSQTRASNPDWSPWTNWLWAWENPHPERPVAKIRFEPVCGAVVISAVTAGQVETQPLRWGRRRKALLRLPPGEAFQPELDEQGRLRQIQLDLGQVISALPRPIYPEAWEAGYNNALPTRSETEVLIEYTAHPQASFHLSTGQTIPASSLNEKKASPNSALTGEKPVKNAASIARLEPVAPATQRVLLRVVEVGSRRPVAVKLHAHGRHGEYLPPVDRHRIPNPAWFEDYSVDFAHRWLHNCTYIPGETVLDLPLGQVYLEISKGFEIRPVRKVVEVTPETLEIEIELEKVLPWREAGWVTADTHVHFLSPMSARLEGSAEGVNIINLLASQWGELMTNVGDFDGETTWGSPETGGDGEWLVRVGTENRQHVLGHISLLGYRGRIIAPMTTGGPDESALGDPIEILLTEWARQCRKQGGVVVLPHYPNPRAEFAAAIVAGEIDAVEMTSWGNLYGGIDPYSLSDWYRYLNCGYRLAAVGGTDKMSADTAVGTVRTYAHIAAGEPFTYENWKAAVRRAETFVTYGPLIDLTVDGQPMGSRISMNASGGTVDVTWKVASVTVPMKRVELIVNGEIRDSAPVSSVAGSGNFRFKVERSSWLALLVRGGYPDQNEIIAAHSSPVMIDVQDSPMLAAIDAVTILEQIEGALAYLDTIGTRAEDRAYKRMRMELVSAHRALHNRMHALGHYHGHTPLEAHHEG